MELKPYQADPGFAQNVLISADPLCKLALCTKACSDTRLKRGPDDAERVADDCG